MDRVTQGICVNCLKMIDSGTHNRTCKSPKSNQCAHGFSMKTNDCPRCNTEEPFING